MKIEGDQLRKRRMQLGLTSRQVAKIAKVASQTISRLEATGDAGVLQVNTLEAILGAVSLSLSEVISIADKIPRDCDLIATLGSYLINQKKGIQLSELAQVGDVELNEISQALPSLEENLRTVGMCLNQSAVGVKIVPVNRLEIQVDTAAARSRYLANLNNGDLKLLFRIFSSNTLLGGITQSANMTMSLQKLEGAGLIEFPSNQPISLTKRALEVLTPATHASAGRPADAQSHVQAGG